MTGSLFRWRPSRRHARTSLSVQEARRLLSDTFPGRSLPDPLPHLEDQWVLGVQAYVRDSSRNTYLLNDAGIVSRRLMNACSAPSELPLSVAALHGVLDLLGGAPSGVTLGVGDEVLRALLELDRVVPHDLPGCGLGWGVVVDGTVLPILVFADKQDLNVHRYLAVRPDTLQVFFPDPPVRPSSQERVPDQVFPVVPEALTQASPEVTEVFLALWQDGMPPSEALDAAALLGS